MKSQDLCRPDPAAALVIRSRTGLGPASAACRHVRNAGETSALSLPDGQNHGPQQEPEQAARLDDAPVAAPTVLRPDHHPPPLQPSTLGH